MATVKTTITLQEDDLRQIRELIASGKAPSISGFIQHAVTLALHDVSGWGAILSGALKETGGPITKDERAWADTVLAGTAKTGTRRSRAA